MLPPDQVRLELPVDGVDPDVHAPLLARLAAEGVEFVTLAAEQRRVADWLERFTELDNATRGETGDPAVPRTPDQMRARLAEFRLEPEACFLAVVGGRWVAYTLLDPALSEDGRLEQGWTGVRAEHRRRGIATALKALGVGYARAHGFRSIVTAPRRRNAASLGMSAKIGFRPAPAPITDDVRAVIAAVRLCFAATVTPDGRPNLSPKGTIRVWDDAHVFFLDIASPRTRANLAASPWIELNVVDQLSRRGYRIFGRATAHAGDDVFRRATEQVFREEGTTYPVHAVVLVAVERCEPVVSPGYLHVPDEWAMREAWRARRAELEAALEAHIRARGPWPGTPGA